MKASVAYIGERFEEAIGTLGEPMVAADHPSRWSLVSGFRVENPGALEAERKRRLSERCRKQQAYEKDRDALRQRLVRAEVSPLAVVPAAAFARLCDEAKLLRLAPDRSGTIGIRADRLIGQLRDQARKIAIACWGPAMLVLPLGIFFATWFGTTDIAAALAIGIFVGVMADVVLFGFIFSAALAGRPYEESVAAIFRRLARGVDRWPAARFLSRVEIVSNFGARMPLRFPDPPAEVAEIVRRVARMPDFSIGVALEPSALAFAAPPSEFLRDHLDHAEIDLRSAFHVKFDPILFVEQGSAVAIVAQYGDFPFEREVVDKVAAITAAI